VPLLERYCSEKISILIVDDSAVVRQVLQVIFEHDPSIQGIGAVPDPILRCNA